MYWSRLYVMLGGRHGALCNTLSGQNSWHDCEWPDCRACYSCLFRLLLLQLTSSAPPLPPPRRARAQPRWWRPARPRQRHHDSLGHEINRDSPRDPYGYRGSGRGRRGRSTQHGHGGRVSVEGRGHAVQRAWRGADVRPPVFRNTTHEKQQPLRGHCPTTRRVL